MDIIRTWQTNWIGHIKRGDSLQREIMEGRMEGKMGRGSPRQNIMDWMMEDGYGKLKERHNNGDWMMSDGYSTLKEEAQHQGTWSHWRSGPARGQRT